DELMLFFHHVPYTHQLRSGKSVIQHIYDSHFEGLDKVLSAKDTWEQIAAQMPTDVTERVNERLAEQVKSATDWRDIINTYFYRKSGIKDEQGREIYS
ncbi:MAG: alpha-glucuronidase, partial [Promicromonosporaceae bacterium]|nr:alpha-glucuronidase [Promicromonosporaceae bacterium]